MAKRIPAGTEDMSIEGLSSMYIVDTPVGKGGDNQRKADNQLVKLFLRSFFNLNPELFKSLRKPGGGIGQVIPLNSTVDGQTIAAITVFQQEMKKGGNKSALIVDGRVSKPTGFTVAGSTHIFTIFQLNSFFFENEENRKFIDNLEDHPNVKFSLPELAAELGLQTVLDKLRGARN